MTAFFKKNLQLTAGFFKRLQIHRGNYSATNIMKKVPNVYFHRLNVKLFLFLNNYKANLLLSYSGGTFFSLQRFGITEKLFMMKFAERMIHSANLRIEFTEGAVSLLSQTGR